jgi:hypothetical protein
MLGTGRRSVVANREQKSTREKRKPKKEKPKPPAQISSFSKDLVTSKSGAGKKGR